MLLPIRDHIVLDMSTSYQDLTELLVKQLENKSIYRLLNIDETVYFHLVILHMYRPCHAHLSILKAKKCSLNWRNNTCCEKY